MKSTRRFNNNKKGLECLNCGQPLRGDENFCSACGQVNDEIPLSIKQFISEFFAGFLSFDTQFFNTIVPLLFKPGKVSKEYIRGKRRKYTNPFKMYLHTSIVFFLLLGLLSTIDSFKNLNTDDAHVKVVKDSIANELKKSGIKVGALDSADTFHRKLDSLFQQTDYKIQFNNDHISQDVKDSLYNQLYEMGMKIKLIDLKIEWEDLTNMDLNANTKEAHKLAVKGQLKKYFQEHAIQYTPKDPANSVNNFVLDDSFDKSDFGRFIKFSKDNKDLSPAKALDSLGIEKNRMNLFKYQKAKDINKLSKDKDYRNFYLSAVVSKISIALFFLLPVFTLFFSLFYIRHPYTFTEHLVVVFNLQTVFFLFLIVGILLDTMLKTDVFKSAIFPLLFFFYTYKTLRNFYGQRRFKTLLKFLLFNFIYFFLAIIGLMMVSFIAFII